MDKLQDREASLKVGPENEGAALGAVVRSLSASPWSVAKRLISTGKVLVDGVVVTDPGERLRAGQTVALRPAAARVDAVALPRDAILHLDPHLVVVNKPPGVSTVPYEEGERGTLVDRVRVALNRGGHASANAPLFVVHRIDKETSGLVVFARTWLAKRHLAGLFREHRIERTYLAIAIGHLARGRITFDTHLVENRGDGLRGSAKQRGLGVRAVTHVEVLAKLDGPATLLKCQLETGRTHQIRIHLAESGHPLVGEKVYSRHFEGPVIKAPRMMLHAATLGFTHPADFDNLVRFACPVPEDFAIVARELGADPKLLKVGS